MANLADTFVATATGLLTALPRSMQAQRAEALEAVLELGSALQRSIDLAVLYLRGADGIDNPQDLDKYLSEGRMKLRETSDEFQICKRLYLLRDKLNLWFSGGRFAVSQDARRLVDILVHGERSVIDEITHSVPPGLVDGDEEGARVAVRQAVIELQQQSEEIRRAVRQFVDSM